ncbi:hypothetical protein BC827DRAFT_1156023 [Russula dissimulans]|nr:hypothetical protein BC827DRAFT_1156023 [Russula dissimulans]
MPLHNATYHPGFVHPPIPNGDARLDGSKSNVPPAILLDYMYISVGKPTTLFTQHKNRYWKLLNPSPTPPNPSATRRQIIVTPTILTGSQSQNLLDAMDNVIEISWRVRLGMIPREVAAQPQKQEEEKHLKEQETAQMKVLGWMGRTDTTVASESDTGPAQSYVLPPLSNNSSIHAKYPITRRHTNHYSARGPPALTLARQPISARPHIPICVPPSSVPSVAASLVQDRRGHLSSGNAWPKASNQAQSPTTRILKASEGVVTMTAP